MNRNRPDTAGGRKTHVITTEHLTVRYPDRLRVVESAETEEAELVLAFDSSSWPVEEFRPNLVFTVVPSTTPLIDASVAAIAAAGEQHPGARVFSVDVVGARDDAPEAQPIGRVMSFIYPADEINDVMVTKWVFATGRHHIHASLSTLTIHALAADGWGWWIVEHMSLAAGDRALRAAAGTPSQVGVPTDVRASEKGQFPAEHLAVVGMRPPQRSHPVSATTTDLLIAEWAGRNDGPTVLFAVVTRAGVRGRYIALPGRDGVLVIRSSGTSVSDFDPETVEAYAMDITRLAGDFLAWLGVQPAWNFSETRTVPDDEYVSELEEAERRESWTEIALRIGDAWARVVVIPGSGMFKVTRPGRDDVRLASASPAEVVQIVLSLIDRGAECSAF